MVSRAGKLTLALALLLSLWCGSAQALSLQQVGAGFEEPIYVTSDPSDPDRLFVVERSGAIQLVANGEVRPFADISALVNPVGEGGLLSIALSPDFAASGRFFVYYTGREDLAEAEKTFPDIHIAEMVASGATAATSSLRNLQTIPHPNEDNHYGGQLQIGPEGNLFASTGDGGGSNDQEHNAQDPTSLLGKILRLTPSAAIPEATAWSMGLRNPFRFSFDRLVGDLWIGDVGQGVKEEVDWAPAPGLGGGWNYGWNCYEGTLPGPATDPGCAGSEPSDFAFPVFEYTNPPDNCAAVIGGYVARGPGYGDLYGRYLYGDLCAGDLRSFVPGLEEATDRDEGVHIGALNSFGEDACGRLYAVSGNGPVYRLVGPGGALCPTSNPPRALSPSSVGIRAITKRVLRNRRALITAWVSPCTGRRGQPLTLWRGRKKIGTRHLDRVCSARFRPRITRRSRFRATVNADATYVAAISRKLTVKIKKHPRKRGRR
jgi:glucose/arabinose dehydrogenase